MFDIFICMQRGDPSGQAQNVQKRRRSQSKFNKDLPRYECFCSKQYLSYPALYLHMKNKHNDYFQSAKNGKKVEPTKLIESYNRTEGYKVYKIAVDTNLLEKDAHLAKYMQSNFFDNSKGNFLMNTNGPFVGYPNMRYPSNSFNFLINDQMNGLDHLPQKEAPIEVALNMFMNTLAERPSKHRYEAELFFVLLCQCLNNNYGKINDSRTEGNEVHRYTAEYNSQFIMNILPYFEADYIQNCQETKSFSFFIKKSHIITSGKYKDILNEFYQFVFGRKVNNLSQSNQQSGQEQGSWEKVPNGKPASHQSMEQDEESDHNDEAEQS